MKTAIVTGATSGMGKVTAHALAQQGYELIVVCRNAQKGEELRREISERCSTPVHVLVCDLANIKQVKQLADTISNTFKHIDVLVNNAGRFIATQELSVDGYELTLATNHLSYMQLTLRLLPLLKKSNNARIVNVASEASRLGHVPEHNLAPEKHTGMQAYCNSKMFNIMFTYMLAEQLKGTTVTVNAMHPGGVNTNFGEAVDGITGLIFRWLGRWMRTPEKGAETIIWLASHPDAQSFSGMYFKDKKPIRSLALSYQTDAQQKVWNDSMRMIDEALAK